ncbi:MMPL family transporter [Streptomyces sp. RFCAC02]|uniref:MMPL family transporter n=1 Tax=Streptomyces sp. RFCAC02 TaxID=2499143 RepID=UPI00101F760E|nr:MMPL family transporter [Streptomyces sp. RFCAC02]
MSAFLFRLGRWAFRRRRLVLGIWLAAAVVAALTSVLSGGTTTDVFTIPGTEAQRTTDLLERRLPAFGGGQTQVVLAAEGSAKVTDPGPRAGIEEAFRALADVPQAASATGPFDGDSPQVSRDGTVALGTVQFRTDPGTVEQSTLDAVERAVRPAERAGLRVEYSGSVYPGWQTEVSELPELAGLVIALVILLITFGALAAALLPVVTAVIGIAITMTGVTAAAALVDIASASTTVALMLGLSCGIDYGLFILFRHRDNLLNGIPGERAAGLATGTAGGSVVFAALTVVIALLGLSVVGIPFLTVMGVCAAVSVLIAMLIALTLLPAFLGFAGDRVVRFVRPPGRPGRPEHVARRSATEPGHGAGAAWARFVVRARVPLLIGGIVLLGLLALPATQMRLGLPSGASKPESDTQRRAYDLVADGFGPGANGPLLVVADGVDGEEPVRRVTGALGDLPGVATAQPLAQRDGLAVIQVVPRTGPSDQGTADLVHRIRDRRDDLAAGTGAHLTVGGSTASDIDVSAKLSSALPVFLVVVVGLAFILLTFAFRTFLVPLKSIAGFLLSVCAAFGAQVAMFQWGWGRHLLDITPTETVSFLPIIMLAIIFGLSSDYEVFVVSRVKEEYTATGDARAAVEHGTGRAARVVTAAALIMFSIFVAFMVTDDPIIRSIGFSFAVGVLLDAFVVRLTLVPAVMALAGRRIWSHPRWFDRFLPDPDIEGHRLTEPHARHAGGT